ncbi:hypothetical protein [Marinilactibacillus psychrotolerans]|uniref:hypothetical protein n=1 Tax=Marinilactibacillus psychrotolerans TaxID=191770 RepID=UPI001866BFD9|nr:hypothetical protein [Marinilactibacillus psychrotolerans]
MTIREDSILVSSERDLFGEPLYFLVSLKTGKISDGCKTLQNLNSLQQNIEIYNPLFRSFGVSYLPEEIVVQTEDIDIRRGGELFMSIYIEEDVGYKLDYFTECLSNLYRKVKDETPQ